MLYVRKSEERGHADWGWLDTNHTFSFASYYDPEFMGFGHLRVINEDKVAAGRGFGTHPHRDMEIISYVVDGALAHKDTIGTGSTIRPGEVQLMSAGRGIAHSEMNGNADRPVHFLQIWVLPARAGTQPRYEQKAFPRDDEQPVKLVVSPDGAEGSLTIGQDMRLYRALLPEGAEHVYQVPTGRRTWVQLIKGSLEVNGTGLKPGDGAALVDEAEVRLVAQGEVEALVFDLA